MTVTRRVDNGGAMKPSSLYHHTALCQTTPILLSCTRRRDAPLALTLTLSLSLLSFTGVRIRSGKLREQAEASE